MCLLCARKSPNVFHPSFLWRLVVHVSSANILIVLNGGKKKKKGGERLKAINVCVVCYSRDGAFVHFGKADERVSP